MIIVKYAKVEADDKNLDLDMDAGHVIITGTSPKATVTIGRYVRDDQGKERVERVDKLEGCEVKAHRKGGHVISGTSKLASEIPGVERSVTLKVGPGKGCATC